MVLQFLVPSGLGQHDLAPIYPKNFPANHFAHDAPQRVCLWAGVITGTLSILGRNRPGTFIRCAAYMTPVLAAQVAIERASFAQVKQVVLKRDGITDIKPAKFVARSSAFNLDDCAVGGAIIAVLLACLRKPFPGVSGWRRYVGVSQVGWMAGSVSGTFVLKNSPGYQEALAQGKAANEGKVNASIKHNVLGMLADPTITGWKSWYFAVRIKYLELRGTPLRTLGYAFSDAASDHLPAPVQLLAYERVIQFDRQTFAGCDHNGTRRTYTWSTEGDAIAELNSHINHLKDVRTRYDAELQHIIRILARKEKAFYAMTSEDNVKDDKDDLRHQLKLLESVVETSWLELSVIDYNITSSTRLRDILAKDFEVTQDPRLDLHAPHMATLHIRQYWNQIANAYLGLSQVPKDTAEFKDALEEAGVDLKEFEYKVEVLRKDFEAAGRLLKEFELRIQKFESGDHEAFERLLKEIDAPPRKDEVANKEK